MLQYILSVSHSQQDRNNLTQITSKLKYLKILVSEYYRCALSENALHYCIDVCINQYAYILFIITEHFTEH